MRFQKAVIVLAVVGLVFSAAAHTNHHKEDNSSETPQDAGTGYSPVSEGYSSVLEALVVLEAAVLTGLGFLAFRLYRRTS